jgi:DnaK suppressor protein
MAKPKRGAARRSGKQAKSAARPAKARSAKKTAVKSARKPAAGAARKSAGKAVRKPAKKAVRKSTVKAARKPAVKKAARPAARAGQRTKAAARAVKKPANKKAVKAPVSKKKTAKTPTVKKAASPRTPKKTVATRKPAVENHARVASKEHAAHGAAHVAHQPARKPVQHVRPTGGVAARLSISNTAEQTITREDGRYALPATVNIELPKGYRPSPDEEYMNPRQLAYFRQKLKDWRDQLVEESRQTMENLREEVRDVGDDAERATRETENSLELRTRDRYRKLISKIEKALRKIEEGRYGYCEETDEEIGLERLEARPIATLSLDAQERREHLQKQMGD